MTTIKELFAKIDEIQEREKNNKTKQHQKNYRHKRKCKLEKLEQYEKLLESFVKSYKDINDNYYKKLNR